MTHQHDLFSSDTPATAPASTLAISIDQAGHRLSPAQQRFNRLLARIENLKEQVEAMQTLADIHRPLFHRTLGPLRERHIALMRSMALGLDERLKRKGLSQAQKRTATEILCSLCEAMAAAGDTEMHALHDKHSTTSLHEKQQAAAADVRAMMEGVLGQPLAEDQHLGSVDEVLHAGMEQLNKAIRTEQARRDSAKARRKPTAAQRKAEQQQHNAEATLRKVYRQLASALHPDRESDPEERSRKTSLMSEANAAHDRRDLVALLQVQLRSEGADSQSLCRWADEKVAAMSLLLKQQASTLEHELYAQERQAVQEFDLPAYAAISASSLRQHLALQEQALIQDLAFMEQEMQAIQDDAAFKRWLKEQKKLAKQSDPFDEFDPFGSGVTLRY